MCVEFEKGTLLNKMIVLATNSHAGQYDKGGLPYILHTLSVMYLLQSEDEELNCIALGHDLIEDTKVTFTQLYELGFTNRVVLGIKCMTKMPGETYDEYREKVKSNMDSVLVKIADITHNTDINRLKGVAEKDMQRIERYLKFYVELREFAKANKAL